MKDRSLIRDILFFIICIALIVMMMLSSNITQKNSDDSKIVGIHIKGEVNAPGYYELNYGSRIKDAIKAAGSETKRADLSSVNLALRLSDGEEIVIPAIGAADKESSSLIDINTADMYKLCKLDGIGESIASDIIEYRTKNGGFKSVTELKKIKGIGNSKFNNIKDKITVQ